MAQMIIQKHLPVVTRIVTGILILFSCISKGQPPKKLLPEICLSPAEQSLFDQVNEYRKQHGLDAIPFSKSLTYVAKLHVYDLAENNPASRRCNLHSWSDNGPWSPCCYTEDHKLAQCMWDKPGELTNYSSQGYEIAYWTDEPGLSPERFAGKALAGWKRSSDHNTVIMNTGPWRRLTWKAMGVAVYKGYAAVWFGEVTDDDESSQRPCDN